MSPRPPHGVATSRCSVATSGARGAPPSQATAIGMQDTIRDGADGWMDAPTKPGLGYGVDWEAIGRLTVREV